MEMRHHQPDLPVPEAVVVLAMVPIIPSIMEEEEEEEEVMEEEVVVVVEEEEEVPVALGLVAELVEIPE